MIIFSILSLSLSAAPVDTVIENLSAFKEHFSVSTNNITDAFKDAFAAKPQLVFYYNGMSYTTYNTRTDCEVQYTNTDIIMNSIQVANSLDGLYDCLRSALMKVDLSVNVVLLSGKDFEINFPALIDQIHDQDYIAYMGYKSISVRSFSNNHSDAVAYKIEFKYGYDSATLVKMKQDTKDEIARLTSEVFTPGMSEYTLVKSIHDYLIDNTVYSQSSSEQIIYYAYGPLLKGIGVCEGYSEAAQLLFDAVGIESIFVTGTVDDKIPHAWNIVKIGGNYYQLDITWDDPITPDGRPNKTYEYFNITDAKLALDHVWSGTYPRCTATDQGIRATGVAVRPQSQAESSAMSIQLSSIQTSSEISSSASSSKLSGSSASTVSLQAAAAASQPSVTSGVSQSSIENSSEALSAPVLPTFPSTNSKPATSEQSSYQLSVLISNISNKLGLSIPIVTTLLFALLATFVLIVIYLIFRNK